MKRKILVLIGDNSLSYGKVCAQLLKNLNFNVILSPNDGLKIFETIKRREPDVVVLDYYTPHIDAVGIMKTTAYSAGKPPIFIVTSTYDHSYIKDEVLKLGAAEFKLIPFDLNSLCSDIIRLTKDITPSESKSSLDNYLDVAITSEIRKIGIPAHLKGYYYIRESLAILAHHPDFINMVTKALYPEVAKKFGTTSVRVERSIRNAVDVVWNTGNKDVLQLYFPNIRFPGSKRPSNAEFLATLSDSIRIIVASEEQIASDH